MAETRVEYFISASRRQVYRAMLDPAAVARWKVPDDMTCTVHVFEPWEGGAIRVSLTYLDRTSGGKTQACTDTYHGQFVQLVPDERIVEVDEFETDNPAFKGRMVITVDLREEAGGTRVRATHEGLPVGVRREDNEVGWRMALARLAHWIATEAGPADPTSG